MSRLGCLTVRVAPTKCYLEHGGVIGSNMGRVDGYAGVQPGETAVIIFMPGYGVRTRQGAMTRRCASVGKAGGRAGTDRAATGDQ